MSGIVDLTGIRRDIWPRTRPISAGGCPNCRYRGNVSGADHLRGGRGERTAGGC